MTRILSFNELGTSDLMVDAVYEGGNQGNTSDDPISCLVPGIGNMAGFRHSGHGEIKKIVVLYTSGEDRDWPDTLNVENGRFIYYGDNKKPGHELHDTARGGNIILKNVFNWLHSTPGRRDLIPPFLIFKKSITQNSSRSVRFTGLAVPGAPGLPATEDLVAVWKTTSGERFQNYRAIFTVLDVPVIPRKWLEAIAAGANFMESAPAAWRDWVETGRYMPLISAPTTIIRTVEEQTPDTPLKVSILSTVHEHFKAAPIAFEAFAARIFQMHDQRVKIDEITRGVIDGGRDAIGRYLLGLESDPIYAEFSLEAKCYQPPINGTAPNTVGVKEVSRLISRIRHRQFGVLVTTSVIARQAYEEVREDRHPIIFIAGRDVAEILIKNNYNTQEILKDMLNREYPVEAMGK